MKAEEKTQNKHHLNNPAHPPCFAAVPSLLGAVFRTLVLFQALHQGFHHSLGGIGCLEQLLRLCTIHTVHLEGFKQ